jgi:glucose/arabinose dehydrogenase
VHHLGIARDGFLHDPIVARNTTGGHLSRRRGGGPDGRRLSYDKPVTEKQVTLGLARGRWNGNALGDVPDIFVLRRESLLVDLRQRIRAVRQGPDGLLYVLTDHDTDGALLRIEPAP